MKFTISAKALATALSSLRTVISSRPPMPILSNVLIEADEEAIKVTASNLDTRIQLTLPCEKIERGAITLPFSRLVAALPHFGGDVTCSVDENDVATLSAGKLRLRLNGLTAAEFPTAEIPAYETQFKMHGVEFYNLLRKVSQAMATPDIGRPALEGVLLDATEDNKVRMIATDGRRAGIAETSAVSEQPFSVTIPASAIRTLLSLDYSDTLRVWVSGSAIGAATDQWRLMSAAMADQFPNWRQVGGIAEQPMTQEVAVKRDDALAAMDFAAVTLDAHNRLFVVTEDDRVSFASSGSDAGDAAASVPRVNGEGAMKFVLNANNLRDTLRVLDGPDVSIRRIDNLSPLVIRERGFTSILWIMRIGDPNT